MFVLFLSVIGKMAEQWEKKGGDLVFIWVSAFQIIIGIIL